MEKKIQTVSSILLGSLLVIFGLNKFIGFIAVEPPNDPVAQQFLGAMFSSYLVTVVALFEIISGVLFLIPKTRFVAILISAPILFNIVAFHLAHDFIGNGIWLLPTLLFLLILYSDRKEIINTLKLT